MTDTQTLDSILGATSLWGLEGTEGKDAEAIFRKYARKVHPDMFQDASDKEKAQTAFTHLTTLRDRAEGKEDPSLSVTQQRAEKNTIKGSLNTYELKRIFHEGEVFTKYMATYNENKTNALVSVLNNPGDNELADTHVAAFDAFENLAPGVRAHYPTLIDDFLYQDQTTGETKRAIVTRAAEGFIPLSAFLEQFPQGMDTQTMAPMFSRMLIAVGNLHALGLVHGAPTVDAFLINPSHGALILTDWQFSVPMGQALKHVPEAYEDAYPEYALEGEPVDDRLDIGIIATMAERMLDPYHPKRVDDFLAYCKTEEAQQVPLLAAEFHELMQNFNGNTQYVESSSRMGRLRNLFL